MNRESALLGTETYSIFTGHRPYLDEFLNQQGRLRFIEKSAGFTSITIERKVKKPYRNFNNSLADEITQLLIDQSGEKR